MFNYAAQMLTTPGVRSALSIAPLITGALLSLAPIPSMRQICRTGTPGPLSPLPYVLMFFNSVVWAMYAHLIHDQMLLANSIMAGLVNAVYSGVFVVNTDYKRIKASGSNVVTAQECILKLTMGFMLAIGGCTLADLWFSAWIDFVTALGLVGNTTMLSFYASPLAVAKEVVRTGSTATMSFWLTVGSFVNSMAWCMYGLLLSDDINLKLTGVISAMLTASQISLFALYGISQTLPAQPGTSPRTSLTSKERQDLEESVTLFVKEPEGLKVS